jgi:hypothetical protein
MAAGSEQTPPPERSQLERYGVLAIDRRRKDDGRALILYGHDEDAPETGAGAAVETGADAAVETRASVDVKPRETGGRA